MPSKSTTKKISLFDFLRNLTEKKVPWESYSESEQKAFEPYMIQRFLSMNTDTLELVNFLQRHVLSTLSKREVYKLYLDVLPAGKLYFKYVKAKTKSRWQKELLKLFSQHYLVSTSEAEEYLNILDQVNPDEITETVRKYGKEDKEIKALLKQPK